jgi:hypothetical protein
MANIQGYSAPSGLDLRPTETGVEAVAGAARRLGAYGNQIADAKNQEGRMVSSDISDAGKVAVDYMDHQEIIAGGAHGTQLFDSLTQSKDQAIKAIDPNDPSYGQKVEVALKQWRDETLAPALDKFREGFNTENSQKFAESFIDKTRDHMFTATAADISNAAGIGVRNAVRTIQNTASNTAVLDPSSVPTQLSIVEHSIGSLVDSSPIKGLAGAALKSEVLEKTREQIVKAGAIGAIQKSQDPEKTAAEWTAKYPQYINGAEATQLAGNARQQIRANNYDFEQNRRRQKEVAQDKSTEATNQYIIDVRSQDPKLANDPTAKKILNDPTLTKTDKNNLLNYVDRQMKPETDARTSSTTFVNLLRDLRGASDEGADKIMQKAWDARLTDPGKPGSMSEKDFNQFRAEVVARKTPEGAALEHDRSLFFKQYAGAIAGRLYDPVVGSPKLYAAEMDARRVETDLRRKGLDPHLAYDPSSEYFIGKPDRLTKYSGSMQADLSDKATAPAAAKTEDTGPPASLRGIASLSYSPTRQLYRDDTTGKLYRKDGTEVTK